MSSTTEKALALISLSWTLLALAACAAANSPSGRGGGLPDDAGMKASSDVPNPTANPASATSIVPAVAPNSPPVPLKSTEVPVIKQQTTSKIDKSQFQRAPSISSPTWVNSKPLASDDLRGHVVVVEFWTFACYNCQNTLPYVKAWYEKYRDRGLVVIGVHTPELSFERDVSNVEQAVSDYKIKYPVAIDGDYGNWNRFRVWAWPTWFIIDKEGYIRHSHVGEGDYAGSEAVIQQLLEE